MLKTDKNNKVEKLSIQRSLKTKQSEDGISYYNEFVFNEKYDRPLLLEEY
jgi:hypothetical protein